MASLRQGWGGRWYYLHTGSDDIHGIGEDGGSGCSQGPRDGLKDNVRALLRAQARQLLWNPGKDNASRYEVPPICPQRLYNRDKPSALCHFGPLHLTFSFCFYLHPLEMHTVYLWSFPEVTLVASI